MLILSFLTNKGMVVRRAAARLFMRILLFLADKELCAELREFAYDGLVKLDQDLERDIAFLRAGSTDRIVKRGTWNGCVLSYRKGFPGSVNRDRKGHYKNLFTRLWDAERYARERVRELIAQELTSRSVAIVPKPEPATVGTSAGSVDQPW